MTFKKFIHSRLNNKGEIANSKVIPTYKILYKLLFSIIILIAISFGIGLYLSLFNSTNTILLIVIIVYMLFLIAFLIIFPLYSIYNPYILKKDKILIFIFGLLMTVSLFAIIYSMASFFSGDRQAFNLGSLDKNNLFTWFYYSIVVFSTVGFGDITPISPVALGLTILEIVFHYFYIVFGLSILSQYSDSNEKIILSELKNYNKKTT